MSGIEVAGLVFGVLPILIEAVKGYRAVANSLHTFRHYSKEVKSISLRLKTQKGIFLNHCRLLLRLVEDDNTAEDMLEDESDLRWTSKELNDKLNAILKGSFELCRDIIDGTRDVINEMKEDMNSFHILKVSKKMDETIKKAFRRLQEAGKITFNQSKYERCIANLRDRNNDLNVVLAQIRTFQKQPQKLTGVLVRHKALPDRLQSIQIASRKLHEALCSAWCCSDVKHQGHYAKLCLNAEVEAEVRLDLAISCHEASNETTSCIPHEPPIWLYVQSTTLPAMQCDPVASQMTEPQKEMLPAEILGNVVSTSLKKKASTDLAQAPSCRRKKKRKHVQFADMSDKSNALLNAISPISQTNLPEFDLCETKSICHYLKRSYAATLSMSCLGYLETPCHMYKHKFYLQDRGAKDRTSSRSEETTVCSIFDNMKQGAEEVLDIKDQLKLAHSTALAMLQYNDTPWLDDRWRLGDMSYFGDRQNFDHIAIKTLHLSSRIAQPSRITNNAASMEDVQGTANVTSEEIKYGINNLPIFFLGVALLEIAHWKPMESNMRLQDEEDQVYTARRLAYGRSSLGPHYQRIVQKCIQCNFGFGTELASKALQTAIYNDVVCELEEMIAKLSF